MPRSGVGHFDTPAGLLTPVAVRRNLSRPSLVRHAASAIVGPVTIPCTNTVRRAVG
jgi:hypothetical protein